MYNLIAAKKALPVNDFYINSPIIFSSLHLIKYSPRTSNPRILKVIPNINKAIICEEEQRLSFYKSIFF